MIADLSEILFEAEAAAASQSRVIVKANAGGIAIGLPLFAVYPLDADGLPDGAAPAVYEGDQMAEAMTAFCEDLPQRLRPIARLIAGRILAND